MNIYSWRWSVARGWHWQHERGCHDDTALTWLAVFEQDEPGVFFMTSRTMPKRPPPKRHQGEAA